MADQTITIPKGWKMTTLGEVAKVLSGSTPSTKENAYWDGNIPWITPKDLSGYSPAYIERGERNITEEGLKNSSAQILPKNTILFSSRAPIGYVVIAKNDVTTNQGFKNIICDEKESHFKYFYYWLKKNTGYIESLSSGSTFTEASAAVMKSLLVELPPLPEQRAIAAVLSSLDDKIDLLREQNKTLEATAQTTFKEWFVNFNFPGATGKMVDSELGEIPEGWKVGTVKGVIERFSISYRCDQNDLSLKGKTPIIDQGVNGLYGYTERNADFKASTENPVILFTNHTCNMWFVNYPFCAIQNVIPFRGNADYSIFFVFYMTLGKVKFIEYKGHWPDFEQKKHIIPKPEIANQFAEFVKPLQYKIWNNNSQVETLSKLRDTLLPKLMKGDVRVAGFNE